MYIDIYKQLREKVDYQQSYIDLNEIVVRNFTYKSGNYNILPGAGEYECGKHNYRTDECYSFCLKTSIVSDVLDIHDAEIEDNITFRYHIVSPKGVEKAKEIVLLFHGLNEKDWCKYMPWAKAIAERTGKSVVLFPLAFHMNRAPKSWSESRLMFDASNQRKQVRPNVIASSLSNVAISVRISEKPQRFVWSGLQTYYDVIDFIKDYKAGNHPFISADATVDLFSYSIGSFLSQILIISNENGYFTNSKLCIFCGGPVFNRFSPVTKFILDSEANVTLYSFLVEHLESHMKNDSRLNHYLNGDHIEGTVFRSLLSYNVNSELREGAFRKLSSQILAIGLKQDMVIPPYEMINTLQGKYRDIPVRVDVLDFPYTYKHEDPFPAIAKHKHEVNEAYNRVFDTFCNFLNAGSEQPG